MMRRLVLALALLLPLTVHAQSPTARDTAFVARARPDLDSIARDKSAPQYSKRAQLRLRARMDSLLRGAVVPTPPPLPVASFVVVCGTNLACSFNAGASTGARLSYQWDCGAFPNCTVGSVPAFTFAYPHDGSRTARVTVTDSLGRTATATRTFTVPVPVVVVPVDTVVSTPPPVGDTTVAVTATPAELPRAVPTFTIPAPARIIRVPAGGDLQAALSAAQPGDEIRLAAGATYTGEYRLPTVCGAQWLTIRSDVLDSALPATGVRMTPTKAASAGLARIVAPTTYPAAALSIDGPSCNVRLMGIEVAFTATQQQVALNYGLLLLGDGGWAGGGETQTTLARVPRNILIDRVYLHGSATGNLIRCLALNSANTVVRDSWVSDCHAAGFDSQAIEGWNGPGPFLIENNRLEGAGENVMFGGADPGIVGLIPSDITIRRNHVIKPLTWKGGPWSIKNLFELKSAARTLVEGNVFENSWPASQEGMAIVIKSSHDACGTCTWQGTQDLTFRWNVVRNAAVGLNLQAVDGESTRHVARVTVTDNHFSEIGAEGRAALMLLTHDLTDIAIRRNTFTHAASVGTSRGSALMMAYASGAARRMEWVDNVLTAGAYGLFYDGGATGAAALRALVGDGSFAFTGNAVVYGGGLAASFPTGNVFPASVPAASPPGADLAELGRRVAGVVVSP